MINYRIQAMQKAGFQKFPATTAEFLDYVKATKKNNTPAASRSATPRATAMPGCIGALWAQRRKPGDKDDKVILNSPEPAKALEYAKQLYDNMIPAPRRERRVNNKAFLGGGSTGPTTASRSMWRPRGIQASTDCRRHGPRGVPSAAVGKPTESP